MKGEVQIYRNLHRKSEEGFPIYSVRNAQGLVEAHVDEIALIDPKFRVSVKGRDRVRKEGRKNVHAYIQGKKMGGSGYFGSGWQQITYNPYRHDHFVLVKDESMHVVGGIMVHIEKGSVWVLEPKLVMPNLLEV